MSFDFVAIDFETANRNNSSACSIGIAAVKDMNIVETKYFLIQPPTLDFDKKNLKKFQRINIAEITASTSEFNANHAFYGKSIMFTGELKNMERKDAMQKVVDLGAIVKSGVSSKINFLVVGAQDKALVGDDGLSTKEEKAYDFIKKGFTIKILTESEFLNMI